MREEEGKKTCMFKIKEQPVSKDLAGCDRDNCVLVAAYFIFKERW